MLKNPPEFIPLPEAAERLGVPMAFLRREALAGCVPFLRAGRRMLFDVQSVHQALVERAALEPQEQPA